MKQKEFNEKLYKEIMGEDKQKAYDMLMTKFKNMPLQNRRDMETYIDGLKGTLIKIVDKGTREIVKEELREEMEAELRAEIRAELEAEMKTVSEALLKSPVSLVELEEAVKKAESEYEKYGSLENKKLLTAAKTKLTKAKKAE